jgi:hypothetical protein
MKSLLRDFAAILLTIIAIVFNALSKVLASANLCTGTVSGAYTTSTLCTLGSSILLFSIIIQLAVLISVIIFFRLSRVHQRTKLITLGIYAVISLSLCLFAYSIWNSPLLLSPRYPLELEGRITPIMPVEGNSN